MIRASLIKKFNLFKKFSPSFVLRFGESLVMGAVDNKAGSLPREAKRILQSLASSWGDVIDSDALQVIPLKGAMTNEVYQIKWPTNREHSRKVLVRIYGEGVEIFFDRNIEIQTFEFMSKHGQGPRLLARFPNGRIEEFIHARTLSASDLRDPDISALIAAKMKEFHDLDMPGLKNVFLWDRLRNWLSAAKSMSAPEEAEAFRLDALEQEISILENNLSGDDHLIVFCHNDLQYGNIMIDDEETRSITIIDYEYASYNPIAYDIANHFCEMAADYHTETPHILDFSKYPGLEERQRFVRIYLSSSGDQPSDLEMEELVQDIEKYTLASHLLWGLWGIISEHVNEIDFYYMEYARQRFEQYWLRKPELLGSSGAMPAAVVMGCR
uniref:Putative choline kinase 2 isoform X3 n=1 Tax=Davidia involucrata TaxID=16924 RepID=A0A5B6YXP9_DAVIN